MNDVAQAVFTCQQQFWQALQFKDAELFSQVLADDFVCRSPDQPEQSRTLPPVIGRWYSHTR
jgi:hypothetical protein